MRIQLMSLKSTQPTFLFRNKKNVAPNVFNKNQTELFQELRKLNRRKIPGTKELLGPKDGPEGLLGLLGLLGVTLRPFRGYFGQLFLEFYNIKSNLSILARIDWRIKNQVWN